MKAKTGVNYQSLDESVPFKIERRSSFRASLKKMGYRIGGRTHPAFEPLEEPLSCTKQVLHQRTDARLPVVSLYAPRADMRFVRRKPSLKEKEKSNVKVISRNGSPSVLSPGSKSRVERLVKKLGPEAFEAAKCGVIKSSVAKRKQEPENKNLGFEREYRVKKVKVDPPQSDPPKRRRSLGNLLDIDEEDENQPLKSNVGPSDVMKGRIERNKKIPPIDIHLTALFAAVENGQVDKAKTILESTDVDINGVNSDGLSPLDIAALSNNKTLIKMLIAFGAQEGNEFSSGDNLLAHLRKLSCEADQRVLDLTGQDPRNQGLWKRRSKGLSNMIMGFTQSRPPDKPALVAIEVTGSHTVSVRYQGPENEESHPCTKYKIEWSGESDFKSLSGYRLIMDPRQQDCSIDELNHGQRYYFRVTCGNIKGWGCPRNAIPASVVPSSWRDVVRKEERLCSEGLSKLDKLFSDVRTARPDIKAIQEVVGEKRKKTTIKQLFTAASKFQKNLRRGVYLSCLLYHEDKVLVTNEDFLPVIEVDETYPGSIYHDFHWLLKVACTWDDVKWLRQDMEKSLSSPTVHFRIKLLQAAAQMQTALSVQDLGQLYHKPLRDSEGTIVICTVNYVRTPKSVSVLNSRWVPLCKLKRVHNLATDVVLSDILMSSIPDQITYHQVSSIRLPKGLYLGYLKMRSSVDLLQVLVPAKSPNVPPHCKIRDNPHITAEEWECLTNKCGSSEMMLVENERDKCFVEQVASTVNRLLTYMQVSLDQSYNHRLYDAEVVEISEDVSMLIVVPPPESACSAPGQGEILLQRPDLIPLPVQVFEMVHLGTYHKQLVTRYSRLSCIVELDIALAQHNHREAFSSSEVSVAKEKLVKLETLQLQVNTAWKQARWLLDVLAFARDKLSQTPTNIIRQLLSLNPKRSNDSIMSQNGLLLPPEAKHVKSRGSWPGPGVSRLLCAATAELSRSEHHLSSAGNSTPPAFRISPPVQRAQPPPKTSPPPTLLLEQPRLPPSKSEDTLALHTRVMQAHSRNRKSSSATTSPSLSVRQGYGSGSMYSLSSDDSGSARNKSEAEEGATVPAPSPGILQVYAAYETGLASGTSLKLHVSPRTTAREVVDLVVKQLNMAVVLKGKDGPIYPAEQLQNFCLVAVIGARERCLRDDFKPLQLQNPWKKGRLYVRQKQDVLAALEQSSKHSAYL